MSRKTDREAAIKAQEAAEKSALNPTKSKGLNKVRVLPDCPVKFEFEGNVYDIRTIKAKEAKMLAEHDDFDYIRPTKETASSGEDDETGTETGS